MRLLTAVVLLSLLMSAVAVAAGPRTIQLAAKHGHGSVIVSTGTTHLRGRLWLVRIGGAGVARGSALLSCASAGTSDVARTTDSWFKFSLKPSGRQLVWRSTSGSCGVRVSVTGSGLLSVALRGY